MTLMAVITLAMAFACLAAGAWIVAALGWLVGGIFLFFGKD